MAVAIPLAILYSPHRKGSAGEAGISAGNEDVAIHGKKTYGEHLKHSCKPNSGQSLLIRP